MNLYGLVLGAAAFLCIGIFHPLVIKAEYYFSWLIWPVFLIVGIIALVVSVCISSFFFSAIVGIFGFSCLWSILELRHQKKTR